MNLVFTAELLQKRIAALLQPMKLSPPAGLVLGILADAPSPLPPNEIADRLIITRATVTGLLDSLERRGYIERQPHPSDRRSILATITEQGRVVAAEFRQLVHEHEKRWFDVLEEHEQQQIIELLHRLQTSLLESE